jgi:hypothetical protein
MCHFTILLAHATNKRMASYKEKLKQKCISKTHGYTNSTS